LAISTKGILMNRILHPLLAGVLALAAGAATADSITFYQDDNFRGRHFTADRAVGNFADNGFNDRARSAVVHEGRWEICVDSDFDGGCSVLAPGAYPELGAYAGRITSVRPVEVRYSGQRSDYRRGSRDARATLYEGPNLSGRAHQLSGTMQNMGTTGFNDRASSLRVESGYWIFCSDADFRGECRTFGPGDYPVLSGMNNAISSGRQIASEYPYAERPDWQRETHRQSQNYPIRPQ
jgi:hypothetical protein